MDRRIGIAGLIWTGALLLSRIIGLVRETVLGATLGVSSAADVYAASFRIPDNVSHVISGGALSIIFIPMFLGHLQRGDEPRAWRAFSVIANFVLVLFGALTVIVWVAMPWLAPLFAPGFSPEDTALLVRLSRIVLPAQGFHLLGGLLSAALLARDRHAVPALAPLVYTLGVIAGGLIGGSAEGFAWGVLAGAFCGPFLLPFVACLRGGMQWRPVFSLGDPDFRAYLAQSLPIMLAFGVVFFDDTVWTWFASSLGEGQVAVLNYAKTLMKVPMGVFGMAMGYAAYPTIARLCNEGKQGEAYRTLSTAARRALVLAFGSQVVLSVAGPELGTLVLGTTRIPPERMNDLGACLALFSLGLAGWTAQTLLSRGFYARGRSWLPTWLGFAVMIAALPLYWALSERWGAWGLATASSVAMLVYVGLLETKLRREIGEGPGYGGFLARTVPATVLGIVAGMAVRPLLGEPDWTRMDAFVRVLPLGLAGGGTFLAACWVLGVEELRELAARVRPRLVR